MEQELPPRLVTPTIGMVENEDYSIHVEDGERPPEHVGEDQLGEIDMEMLGESEMGNSFVSAGNFDNSQASGESADGSGHKTAGSPTIMRVQERIRHSLADNSSSFSAKSTKQRLLHKQHPMLVLDFRQDGSYDFLELRREDILQEARKAVPELAGDNDTRLIRVRKEMNKRRARMPTAVREKVARESTEKLKERIRFKGTLQNRDVRLLDSTFSHSHDPGILVRRHAILVNLEPIKALLFHNRTLVFVPDGADSILSTLMARLREVVDVQNPDYKDLDVPFVIRSLEAIFVTTCNILNQEVKALIPEVHGTVMDIIKKSSGVTIEKLRQAKSKVTKISSRLLGVQHAFEELLNNDRDMALMRLDKVNAFPEYYDDKNEARWCIDHEQIELLLENYAQAVDGSYSQVDALRQEIESAMSTITLRLDTARNKLLGIELLVSSVTSAAAIGALFAGLFGMNLDSGVENDPYWFWTWFGLIVGGVPLMVFIMFFMIYRQGLLIT